MLNSGKSFAFVALILAVALVASGYVTSRPVQANTAVKLASSVVVVYQDQGQKITRFEDPWLNNVCYMVKTPTGIEVEHFSCVKK